MKYEEIIKQTAIKSEPIIMGIETSCDETAVSIVKGGREVLCDEIISSATEHVKYGGVVPEIASRMHTEAILTATKQALQKANLTLNDIDAFAVTYGAGLLGALLVGVSFAKSLAYSLNKPLVPVNHIRGHISAAYLADKSLEPPFIVLLASGGHTAIIKVDSYLTFEVLGATYDDAVGEAFDKVARVLGLNYPGGPNIEREALKGETLIPLPKMLKGEKSFNFSYSGLKTAVINYVHKQKSKGEEVNVPNVAYSFQKSAVEAMVERVIKASKKYKINTIAVCGGVGANGYLRKELELATKKEGIKLILPEKRLCTDNGSMIGAEGTIQYLNGNFASLDLNAEASIPLIEKGKIQK